MKKCNGLSLKKILISALAPVTVCFAVAGGAIMGDTANALPNYPLTTTLNTPLYDFDEFRYNEAALDDLAKIILDNPSANIDTLISNIKSNAQTHGRPVSNKGITLKYGRYRNTVKDPYTDLAWMPVYMSTTADGKDAVLTLYLTSVNGPISQYEYSPYSFDSAVASSVTAQNPANMYGTSYIRANALGNGGQYIDYTATSPALRNLDKPTYESCHKYIDFQEYVYTSEDGNKEVRKGYLYDDIVTPSKLAWQGDQNYKAEIGDKGEAVYNGSTYGGADWENYCWPNDSYASHGDAVFYMPNYFDYGSGTAQKTNYDIWKNDKVWLPSVTEVGTGDMTGNDTTDLNGLWELNKNQRSNNYSSSLMAAQPIAWLRSASTAYDAGSGYSYSHIFVTEEDGSVGFRELNYVDSGNSALNANTFAVRPAIHLNLSAAAEKTEIPVNLPDVVKTSYNGKAHRLDQNEVTLTPEEASWFIKGDMNVRFAYDKDFKTLASPINAGEYYMEVRLDNPGLHFVNSDSNKKVVKFIVEKAKIGVKWTYQGVVPTDVEMSAESHIYDRDVIAGNVPRIGIKYRSYHNAGLYFYDFDDLLRGTYTAEAYIIDEDLYKYNYQLSDEKGEPITSNSTFDVGRKIIEKPHVEGAGEGVLNDKTGIIVHTISYKGDQFIQLANVSKYLCVSVKPEKDGEIECLNEMHDVEVNGVKGQYPIVSENGTLTYKVSSVDLYTFTIQFYNETQFTWPGDYDFSTGTDDGKDTTPYKLGVNVSRAKLEVEFVGLPNEWSTITIQTFEIALRGIYEHIDGDQIPLDVMYISNDTGTMRKITPTDGVYTLSGLPAGNYTLYAGLTQTDDNKYFDLYYIESGNKQQDFKVLQTVSSFSDSLVQWQYTNDGTTEQAGNFVAHDRPESALEFDFNEDFYAFSLTLGDAVLRDTYYVKAVYYGFKFNESTGLYEKGDKFVKSAGKYKVTVKISAYYPNVQVDDKSYDIYFNINPSRYDLSGLQWDYSGTPFTYDGAKHKVQITADSLAALPGLTVEYTTAGNRIDAGSYKTKVNFLLSGEYAKNYILPDADDDSTYDGTFAFEYEWFIGKAKLTVEWQTADDSTGSILFIPRLRHGHEYVVYSYEHKESDGSWSATDTLTADGVAETYRVNATLKPEYANNYELDLNVPCEFTVESGKLAVSIHFEKDGEICNDGDEFVYTGSAVTLELVVDSAGTSLGEYEFKYFSVAADGTRTELAAAPTDVGRYVAEVTAKYSTDSYISEDCKSEVAFSIIKADYDPDQIFWMYEHGDVVIAAKYDKEQGKWVDEKGGEVVFSFEYDGTPHVLTVECLQDFDDTADTLSVARLAGNEETNAGTYTAVVDFDYNSDRFNNPHDIFPRLLSWTITKKKIDYNDVKWGYINKEGQEKEFDFDKEDFRYARDEDGAVGWTVALIGLPKGVQDLMTYTTKNLSISGSSPMPGNTRAAVGEYMTSYVISGTWNDPQGNHEDFDASTFPLSIPTSQLWKIKKRELSKIDYDGSWTVFNDRIHDVIELCNIPYNELDYLKVEITFVDKAFSVFNDYEGYEGVANSLYHAGTYDVKFYEKTTVFRDGAEVEELIVWDTLSLEIDKAEVEVEWDDAGAYPVARALAVFNTDMITTVYTRLNGAEVPLAYIKSTNGDEEFFAKAKISDAYVYDISIKMVANQPEQVKFSYSPFEPKPGVVVLDFPTIIVDEKEFTGTALTFEIDGWGTLYSNYLYISAGSLTQTDVGEYSVVLRFYKTANAYWKQSTASSGEFNRDAYTLKFRIAPPTRWPLDYPMFEKENIDWDNDNEIEFKITNWVMFSQYLTYEVFYKNESLGKEINLIFRKGGVYSVKFSFPEDSIGYWKENPDAPRAPYTVQLFITGDPDNPIKELAYPTFVKASYEYTGSPIQFKVAQWDYYSNYVNVTSKDGLEIKDGVITVTQVGVYTITFTIKDGVEETFVEGKKTYSATITVTPEEIIPGEDIPITKPSSSLPAQTYTGSDLEFTIPAWVTIYGKYLVFSCDDSTVKFNNEFGTITVKNIGVYTFTLSFKEDAHAYWAGTDNSTEAIQITFEVTKPDDPTIVVKPSIKIPELRYNGKEQKFELANFDPEAVEIVEGEGVLLKKGVGEYSVTLRLKNPKSDSNPEGQTWEDGTTDEITLDFKIIKAQIPDGGQIGIGNDGKPIIVDKDGNPWPDFDFDFGDLLDVEFYDKDGNKVEREDLVPGESYTVKIKVKNPADFDNAIENGSSIRDQITEKNENGGFIINNYQPSGSDKEEVGFNLLWLIAIIGIPLILAVVGVIIALVARRNNDSSYDDGYDEYYDDYDDEEDEDEDDYDDDYDDYDDEY